MSVQIDQLLADFGFAPSLENEWRHESEAFVMVLEDAGDGEWLLNMASEKEIPRLQFAGRLGQCLVHALATTLALKAVMLPSTTEPSA